MTVLGESHEYCAFCVSQAQGGFLSSRTGDDMPQPAIGGGFLPGLGHLPLKKMLGVVKYVKYS